MTKIKHTASFTISQPAATLFPLFSAEGEKLWVPDWDYENIMDSKELHEDYVFVTHTHDHASTAAVWLVKRYEPNSFLVQFYKVEPEDKVGIITVRCQPLAPQQTEVEVSYEYIALSDKGRKFIERFTATDYDTFIGEWQTLLKRYFASAN
jgi:hypothetical protein